MVNRTRELANQTKGLTTSFLMNELKIGLTFAELAACKYAPETKQQNQSNARRAYQEVLRRANTLQPAEHELLPKIEELRIALETLADI